MLEDITSAARRNPMQAVAVGASLAYPLLRFAKAIPIPILMVGAGLFFAGSKTGQSLTQKASDMASDLSDEVGRRGHDLSAQASATVNSARGTVSKALERVGETVSTGTDQVRTAVSSVPDRSLGDRLKDSSVSLDDKVSARAADMKEGASALASTAFDSTRDFAAEAATATRNAASSATEASLEMARSVRNKTSDLSNRAGRTVLDTIQENPLLVAGVGLLIGGLIASALPNSELEDDLVGDAAAAAKRRASEAASKGFDTAKGVAGEIFENVARQAGAEGLTPDKLDETARSIGQRVKRVAETAVTTAFDLDKAPNQTPAE
jgi:gas vesicle protein